jgi:hypothetical protein
MNLADRIFARKAVDAPDGLELHCLEDSYFVMRAVDKGNGKHSVLSVLRTRTYVWQFEHFHKILF